MLNLGNLIALDFLLMLFVHGRIIDVVLDVEMEHYAKGTHTVPAELGDTPVFCRKGSQWAELFDSIRAKYGK